MAHFVGKSNWLDSDRLFRPEAMTLTPHDGWPSYTLPVQGVQYLGDTYEVTLENGGAVWMLHSERRVSPDETLTVYIDPEQIIVCEKEKQS